MTQKFFVDENGSYLGAFIGFEPEDGIEVMSAPPVNAFQKWDGSAWLSPIPTSTEVDVERDRRIDAGFLFNGVLYQSDVHARENIAGASQLAFAAMTQGAEAGDLHWHGEPEDFEWIAFDDTRVPMDAQTTFAFGQAALAHKRKHIFAANDLKKMDPTPFDFAENAEYWPTPDPV